jgi:hypothetical protein
LKPGLSPECARWRPLPYLLVLVYLFEVGRHLKLARVMRKEFDAARQFQPTSIKSCQGRHVSLYGSSPLKNKALAIVLRWGGLLLLHCPLGGGEATHAGLDGCVDEPLLQHVAGVQVNGEEAKNGVDTLKHLDQV